MDHNGLADTAPGDLSRWLVQASPDGLWVFDEHGTTVFANARLGEMLRRTPEQMRRLSVYDCMDEQGKVDLARHLAQLATTAHPGTNLECRFLCGDGSDIWALVSHTPIRNDDGEHVGWLHRVTEYSEQRRLLDTLQHREQQLGEAQRIAHIGSWEWDVVQDQVTWSDELYRLYGLDPATAGQLTAQSFVDLLHPDDREHVQKAVMGTTVADDEFEFDARAIRPDGAVVWVRGRGRVAFGADGSVLRMGGTSQDITSTKDAEQALALLSAMATTANEASRLVDVVPSIIADVATHTGWRPVAAWMVDQDGRLDPVDADVRQAPAPDLAEALRLARQAVQTREPAVGTTSEGTTLVAAPIVAEGRAACVIAMDSRATTPPTESDSVTVGQATALFARVAEREWTRERLAAARDDAMAASVAKSEFLATMSHEIRTPLNGVIGLSELLTRTELTERQRRLADGIDNAGRQLLALVNDILDLSKIEAGRLELEEVDFDPRSVIEQSSTIVAEQARRKALELVVSCQPDLPTAVCGDPVRFGQVIANLTANAVKFTASGEVVVRASLERAAQDDTVVLRVEVTDTGSGMTPEVQARLFTAFSQGDTSTTREFGGTGLGLAISRQIVTAMGGEIGVISTRGRGSTFWFTAPFAPATDLPVPASSGTAVVSGLRVLVVDDNDTNRFILEEQLGSWKVDTSLAGSGVEGLSLLDEAHRRGAPFDIVLLDYLMPGVNGEQFARMVRGDGRFADTRIILLSSSMDLNASTLNEAGIDIALTKPVFASNLFDSLATVAASTPATTGQSSRRGSVVTGPTPGGPPRTRGRVLVVEDNAVNQMVAVGILESLGYAASVAENGAVGVATFVADPAGVDAILMDCQMPQMDGYAATRAIRAQEGPGTRVPIIAMTAAAIAGERERCLLAGMDDFLTKPVDVGLLRSTLGRWVRTGRPEANGPGAATDASQADSRAPRAGADVGGLVTGIDPEVLDRGRLEELLDLEPGDPTMLLRFIDRFGTNSGQAMATLVQARDSGDATAMGRAAHGLKGSSANLGATALAALCKEVEDLGDEGTLADDRVLDRLRRERERAVSALEGVAETLRQSA
ncbi:response regulator [Pedococcus sp. KACC 23699]|uniref:Circadian input-output histidine kinase CikA n=1 Tax=Pedococcus sp. KACC 23699 TaxID=3149228 RepID=A0AAU7JY73_9MICO